MGPNPNPNPNWLSRGRELKEKHLRVDLEELMIEGREMTSGDENDTKYDEIRTEEERRKREVAGPPIGGLRDTVSDIIRIHFNHYGLHRHDGRPENTEPKPGVAQHGNQRQKSQINKTMGFRSGLLVVFVAFIVDSCTAKEYQCHMGTSHQKVHYPPPSGPLKDGNERVVEWATVDLDAPAATRCPVYRLHQFCSAIFDSGLTLRTMFSYWSPNSFFF